MPDSLILRFRDLNTDDAVRDHRSLITSIGYVWWGWWQKETEPDQPHNIGEISGRARQAPLLIGLFNSGTNRFYTAQLAGCVGSGRSNARELSPETSKTPNYYSTDRLPAWFKLTSIEEIHEQAFTRQFGGIPVGEGTFFPVWWGQPQRRPTRPAPVNVRGCRVLHLSDVHLGADFGFPLSSGPGATPLLDMIQRDLADRPPGLIIVSGDLTTRADANVLLAEGVRFLHELRGRFSLPVESVVIIPGNHDIPLSQFAPQDYRHETTFKLFLKEFYGGPISYPDFRSFNFDNGVKLELLAMNSVRLRSRDLKNFGYVQWSLYDDLLKATPRDPEAIRVAVLHHHLVSAPREEVPAADFPEASISTTLDAGAVIAGLQHHGFRLALHGHQHVPAVTRVSKGSLADGSTALHGLDTSLTVIGAGSAGANRLNDEMRENSYNVITFDSGEIHVQARRYTRGSAPRALFESQI